METIKEKTFRGKTIYNPSGKAGEYSYWACNFYNGCSNDCQYCYCKRGVMSSNWSNPPKLKSKLKDENHALEIFEKELMQNLPELQKHGLFFSFTTDPMLEEALSLTWSAINICFKNNVNVKILTKCTDWLRWFKYETYSKYLLNSNKAQIAFGFTLTGHDELEPNASSNAERIIAMKRLHDAGFKTWASIEPVIDLDSSWNMIESTQGFCDLYKIGLESGKEKMQNKYKLQDFISSAENLKGKFYFKESFLKMAEKIKPLPENCVTRDYNMFEN